jgi:Flp pilus assembly protein TadB
MASFMPSSYEDFKSEKKAVKSKTSPEFIESKTLQKIEINAEKYANKININVKKNLSIKEKIKKQRTLRASNMPEERPTLKPKIETLRKKRNRNPIINDGVKIGIVFLAIAIGLALIPLSQLSLLFGVVSAIFFIIGLKKYMRKNRFRKLFK